MKLLADPQQLAARYQSAQPFPHLAIDGLFEDELLAQVLAEFPDPDAIPWQVFDNPQEKKLGYRYGIELGDHIARFMQAMSSPQILELLEQMTGIAGLIPDPYFGGGGPHQILPGGFLKIHADFNWHPKLRLDRRLNVLVYLNRDWPEEYGGHLELWDREMGSAVARILPLFNRTVVFSTTDTSYHGHPVPLSCPLGRARRSVSFYYYTNGRPEEERSAPHDTVFLKRPGDDW